MNIRKQRGMTAIGWVLVLLLIGFFALIGLNLAPIYIDSFSVGSILSELKQEPGVGAMSPAEISKTIVKRLDINSVYSVTRDDIYIDRGRGETIIAIEYEVRKGLMGNIDLVVSFDKSVTVNN